MGRLSAEELWERLHQKLGEDLRGVIRFDGTDREMVLRDDVREAYSAIEDRKVVDDAIISQLSAGDTQSTFKVGDLLGNVKIFEEAWVLQYPDSVPGKSGYIVSIQRTGGTASIADIEACLQVLSEAIQSTD